MNFFILFLILLATTCSSVNDKTETVIWLRQCNDTLSPNITSDTMAIETYEMGKLIKLSRSYRSSKGNIISETLYDLNGSDSIKTTIYPYGEISQIVFFRDKYDVVESMKIFTTNSKNETDTLILKCKNVFNKDSTIINSNIYNENNLNGKMEYLLDPQTHRKKEIIMYSLQSGQLQFQKRTRYLYTNDNKIKSEIVLDSNDIVLSQVNYFYDDNHLVKEEHINEGVNEYTLVFSFEGDKRKGAIMYAPHKVCNIEFRKVE